MEAPAAVRVDGLFASNEVPSAAPGALSPHLKRERSSSNLHTGAPPAKAPFHSYTELAAPLITLAPLETKAAFFARLRTALGPSPPFSLAHDFSRPGLYLYKRPVRSASPQHAVLLAAAGSVFHHVIVYVVPPESPSKPTVALEFGPDNGMDVTANMLEDAPAAFPLKPDPELPDEAHLPMIHVAGADEHHPLTADHFQRALRFASTKKYQVIKNNCIAFADFIVRVLTGGAVRNIPLIFDALAGTVPPVDSPMLPMLQLMTGMSWHAVTDGGRLMAEFLTEVGAHAIFPPGKGKEVSVSVTPVLEDAGTAGAGGGDSGCSEDSAAAVEAVATTATGATTTPSGLERSSASSQRRKGPRLPPRRQASVAASSASALTGA